MRSTTYEGFHPSISPYLTMSDTPRTDAEESDGWSGDAWCVSPTFARTLERENIALRAALADISTIQDEWPEWGFQDLYEYSQRVANQTLKEIAP